METGCWRERDGGGGGFLIWDLAEHEQAWYQHPPPLSVVTLPSLFSHLAPMWQAAAGQPNYPSCRSCPPPHFPSPAWWPGSEGYARIPMPKEHFFFCLLLWLQHRPGRARSGCQVSYVTLSSAIFSQAQRNSRVTHAWRLHLIMCGVVTPDHSQPSPSLTPPPPPPLPLQSSQFSSMSFGY